LTTLQREQPGEPVAGNLLGGFCEGGRAQATWSQDSSLPTTGVFWSEIRIESSGGTDPITSHGHRKADAQRIRDLIETYQAQSRV
jgi:hypothetical protein